MIAYTNILVGVTLMYMYNCTCTCMMGVSKEPQYCISHTINMYYKSVKAPVRTMEITA